MVRPTTSQLSVTKRAAGKGKVPVKAVVVAKKPHRCNPGTVARRNIRSQQKRTECLMRKAPFDTIVRTRAQDVNIDSTVRFKRTAMRLIQAIVEAQMIQMMKKASEIARHANRQTVTDLDMQVAQME